MRHTHLILFLILINRWWRGLIALLPMSDDEWLDMQLGAATQACVAEEAPEGVTAAACEEPLPSPPHPQNFTSASAGGKQGMHTSEVVLEGERPEPSCTSAQPMGPAAPAPAKLETPVLSPADHINASTQQAHNSRGKQVRNMRMGSLFSGALPERHVCNNMINVPVELVFSMDSKETAYRFCEENGGLPEHHFVDGRDWLKSGNLCGRCSQHNFAKCSLTMPKMFLDILLAGVSCRPYSTARAKRVSGTRSHQDSDLMDVFIQAMIQLEPRVGVLENVFGFCMPENQHDRTSPLERFLATCKELLPMYTTTVYVLQAKIFMVMNRVRLWVVLVHDSAGGVSASSRIRTLITVKLLRKFDSMILE